MIRARLSIILISIVINYTIPSYGMKAKDSTLKKDSTSDTHSFPYTKTKTITGLTETFMPMYSIAADGKIILLNAIDYQIRPAQALMLYSVDDKKMLETIDLPFRIGDSTLSEDMECAAITADMEPPVYVYNRKTKLLQLLTGAAKYSTGIRISETGDTVATSSADSMFHIWDVASQKDQKFEIPGRSKDSYPFYPCYDKTKNMIGCTFKLIKFKTAFLLCDTRSGKEILHTPYHNSLDSRPSLDAEHNRFAWTITGLRKPWNNTIQVCLIFENRTFFLENTYKKVTPAEIKY